MNATPESHYIELLHEVAAGRLNRFQIVQHAVRMGVSIPDLLGLLATRHSESEGPNRAVVCCDANCESLCYRLIDIKTERMN